MGICSKLKALLPAIVTIGILFVLATSAFGQCAMCRASLAGSNNALFIKNFNIGVLVLLLPPVTIFCSIFIALKRYRAADEETEDSEGDDLAADGRR